MRARSQLKNKHKLTYLYSNAKYAVTYSNIKCSKSGMFRSTWRHTQPFCKVDFTKIKFFAFFLITIRYISQKYIIFAPDFKNGYKITINF